MPSLLPANEDRPPTLNKKRIPIPCTHSLSLSLFVSLSLSVSLSLYFFLSTHSRLALLCSALLSKTGIVQPLPFSRYTAFSPSHSFVAVPPPSSTYSRISPRSISPCLPCPALALHLNHFIPTTCQPSNTRTHTHTTLDPQTSATNSTLRHLAHYEFPGRTNSTSTISFVPNHPNPRPNDNDWPQLADHGR